VEEGKEKGDDICCTPNVQKSIYQGVSVLMMACLEVSTLAMGSN